MAVDRILIRCRPGEVQVAGVDDRAPLGRRLQLFHLFRDFGSVPPGAVVLGRVRAVHGGLNAAFVDIGDGIDGFLSAADARPHRDEGVGAIGDHVHEGAAVLVQVTRGAADEKGAKLTRRVTLPGRHVVYLATDPGIEVSRRIEDDATRTHLRDLAAGFLGIGGWIVRTAAAGAEDDVLATEAAALAVRFDGIEAAAADATPPRVLAEATRADRLAPLLADHADADVVCDDGALARALGPGVTTVTAVGGDPFEDAGLGEEIESLWHPGVALPSGGRLWIDEARALTAIDVDTGAARGASAARDVNRDAAREIARQVRLRGLGGLIVVDFVSLKNKADMGAVVDTLAASLGNDGRVSGPSQAGLVEITRRRTGPSLLGQTMARGPGWVATPETTALAALARVLDEDRAAPGSVGAIAAAPPVIAVLETSPARGDVENRLGRPLDLRTEDGFAEDAFEVRGS